MRILHVAESVKGGCGTYLNEVVRAQLGQIAIESVHVVAPDAHVEQVPDIPAENRTTFSGHGRSPASLLALWQATSRARRDFAPDCIHLHSTFAGLVGRTGLALTPTRPPIVYCAHGWAFDMAGSAPKRHAIAAAERLLSHSCEGVIAISDYERQRGIAAGIPPERIVTVLNGIADIPASFAARAVTARQPAATGRRQVLFIGRLDRQKGVETLLAAVEGLSDRIALRIIGSPVVGDGAPLRLDQPGVTALGWCDQDRIRRELDICDCVVVPSRWEGFGLVAVEAMRAGRAVIATRNGGLPEVVDEGRTGWLVPPEDPMALRHALLSPTDEALRAAGAAGRERFRERFTIERTVAALTAVYRQAIAMRSSISHALPLEQPA